MTNAPSTNADDRTDENQRRKSDELTATVVEYDSQPDECTIYPKGASDEALMTEWITAEQGSYVALEEMR